jgi:hypothetical protein
MNVKSITSGGFRAQIAAARLFGLVVVNRDTVSLTPRGRAILETDRQAQAKLDAFLDVPLFRAIFEKFKGYALPPDVGLETEIRRFGVAPKQVTRARQTFQRSAFQAGFFASGRERLTMPAANQVPVTPVNEHPSQGDHHGGRGGGRRDGGGGGRSDSGGAGAGGAGSGIIRHHLIQGLVDMIPEVGSSWPATAQESWINLAKNIFAVLYPPDHAERTQGRPPLDDSSPPLADADIDPEDVKF